MLLQSPIHRCWPTMSCRSFHYVSFSARLGPRSGRRSLHQSFVRSAIMMPAMSPYMTEGTIRKWAKKEGDFFSSGDILLQIESDYTTINVEAQNPGIIEKIVMPDGSTNVAVEQVIALVAKTPQELGRLHAQARARTLAPPPLTPAPHRHQHHRHTHRGPSSLEHTRCPIMAPTHRTPAVFEAHTMETNTVRGIATDHAGPQHHTPVVDFIPDSEETGGAALEVRKTIVSTLSRWGSGSKSSTSQKCTTAEYFDGIL
ncbi:single hybrid motif-containing protein [Mycena sp. CBHHK59/15]|nr:single hybrid motif-containing protein [Mycena sp. CBHHK59/15]